MSAPAVTPEFDAATWAQIQGDVTGQVAVGKYITQINIEHGHILMPASESQPLAAPRKAPVLLRPRSFPGLLDRHDELTFAKAAFRDGQPLEFYGEEGAGKTSLLRAIAYDPAISLFPDGVIYLRVGNRPVTDVLLDVFDAFFDRAPDKKPTDMQIWQALSPKRALIISDDVELAGDDINALMDVAAGCTFLLATTQRRLWDPGQARALPGLPVDEAIVLLESVLDRQILSEEREAAARLGDAVGFHPLRLLQAAARARETGRSLGELADALAPAGGAANLVDQIVQSLSEPQRRILAFLTALDVPIETIHIAAITEVADAESELNVLEQRHLVKHSSPYRATGVRSVRWGNLNLDDVRMRAFEYFSQLAAENARTPRRLAADYEPLMSLLRWTFQTGRWRESVRLGRAIDGMLTATGQWGTWGRALEIVRNAARSTKDPASEAWALHQLGTRAICVGDLSNARAQLTEALRMREALGDRIGAAVTRHNLRFLLPPAGNPIQETPPRQPVTPQSVSRPFRLPAPFMVIVAMVVFFASIGTAYLVFGDEENTPNVKTTATATPKRTKTPTKTPKPTKTPRVPTTTPNVVVPPTDTPFVPTATPTKTPTEKTAASCAAISAAAINFYQEAVTNDDVNLRSGPGFDCETIETLGAGTRLQVLSQPAAGADGEWIRVRVFATGNEGWINSSFIDYRDALTDPGTAPPDPGDDPI